jgi:hypothetical protein
LPEGHFETDWAASSNGRPATISARNATASASVATNKWLALTSRTCVLLIIMAFSSLA